MDKKIRQPGLDGRHRDQNGRITEKHGNTRVDRCAKRTVGGLQVISAVMPTCAPSWTARERNRSVS